MVGESDILRVAQAQRNGFQSVMFLVRSVETQKADLIILGTKRRGVRPPASHTTFPDASNSLVVLPPLRNYDAKQSDACLDYSF